MIKVCLPDLRADPVPGAVRHDGEQPRLELFPAPEFWERIEGPHKRFLNGILGVRRPCDQYGGAVRDRAVSADELTICLMVAAACGFNQALVADGGDSPGAAVFYLHPPSPQILGAEVTAETRSPMAISLHRSRRCRQRNAIAHRCRRCRTRPPGRCSGGARRNVVRAGGLSEPEAVRQIECHSEPETQTAGWYAR